MAPAAAGLKKTNTKKHIAPLLFSSPSARSALTHHTPALMTEPYTPDEAAAVHQALRTHRATTQTAERALKV